MWVIINRVLHVCLVGLCAFVLIAALFTLLAGCTPGPTASTRVTCTDYPQGSPSMSTCTEE